MCKKAKIVNIIKLSKEEKGNLTLLWLSNLIKEEHLNIEDVIDILNSIDNTFSNTDKLQSLLISGTLSIASVSRILGLGYVKSVNFVQELLKKNVITKYDNCYRIIDKLNFKAVCKDLLK